MRKFKVMAIIDGFGCRWSRGYFNSREEALDALLKEWEGNGSAHHYTVDLIGFWLIEDSVLDKGKKVYGIPKMDESYLIESIAYSLTS